VGGVMIVTESEKMNDMNNGYEELNDDYDTGKLAYLDYTDGERKIVLTDISPTEELLNISNQIWEIQNDFEKIQDLYNLVLSDVAAFKKLKNELEERKRPIRNDTVNRFMLHLLSSGKLFVDFNENQFKDKYSKDSNEFNRVHQFAMSQYDSSFAYRFCYYLRNFSQHVGFPITQINTCEIEDNSNKISVELFIDLDYLLNSNFDWKKMRAELEDCNKKSPFINADELVDNFFHSIVQLYGNYCSLFLELNHHKLIGIKNKLVAMGMNPTKYYITKINKFDLSREHENFALTPILSIPDIDKIYLELSKIGLVDITNKKELEKN
jgi:hypothetical protein